MATYSYKCSDCGHGFNVEATIQEKEEGRIEKFACPKCGSKNIKQEFSAGYFLKNIFKCDKKSEGCCSGGCACDGGTKPEAKKENCCADKANNDGCCN